VSEPTVLVTANAFLESAATAEAPFHAAGVRVRYSERMGPLPPEELIPYLREADAVIAAGDPYVGLVLAACPRLRTVVRWGTGYDTVDVAACTEHGVVACNAPQLNVQAVADHVLAVMLAIARQLPRQIAVMRGDGWEEIRGVELYGKTVGILGFGAIGKAVGRRARGFDCPLLAYDPHLPADALAQESATSVDLPTLFAESDFVTVNAALTPETRGLVSETLLRRMKPTAYLVNAARGPLVDEDALARALREGWIAGASVDAFAEEPLPPGNLLRHLPNCLATPHSAFNTVEAAAATNAAVAEQVLAVLRGERPRFPLNPEVLELPHFRGRSGALLPAS
jgi:phosphoglycerate dehydrogenase-like enzyme